MPRDNETEAMRRYWDDRARENAVFYVDTTCRYDAPDMERFFETGRVIVDEALTSAPVQPSGRQLAVEIGPGLGRVCRALGDHFDRVIGIDVSAEMVQRAKELVPDPRITFQVGDGATLAPLADASADFVVTFTVLQHLTSRAAIFRYLTEAARVLRPGGVIAAQWNNDAHPLRYEARSLWWRLQRKFGVAIHQDNRVAPQFLGTPVPYSAVKATLDRAGLTVRGTKGEGTLFAWVWAEKT